RTAVGLSLMVSPHPSYPPLEMAAFGARVVTNGFANKDLSTVSPSLVTAQPPNPDGFAKALQALTQDFDDAPQSQTTVPASAIVWNGPFLDGTQAGFAWAAQVAAELQGNAPPPPAPQTMPEPDTEKTKTINA
ncbi:MAG: hypothetical protein KAZ24_00570, partial [Brachymonas sp.]|nr:hypothetical protein [Brachymonas sp.]